MYARARIHTYEVKMKQLTLLLLILIIASTGCEALVLDAETGRVEAETARIETQSDADVIAALVDELREMGDQNQAVIDALIADRAAERISHQQMVDTLLEMLAERNEPRVSPWAIVLLVIALTVGGGLWFRRKPGGFVIMMLPSGEQPAGVLSAGEQWLTRMPRDVEREVVER